MYLVYSKHNIWPKDNIFDSDDFFSSTGFFLLFFSIFPIDFHNGFRIQMDLQITRTSTTITERGKKSKH